MADIDDSRLDALIARRGDRPPLGRIQLPDGTLSPARWLPVLLEKEVLDADERSVLHRTIERSVLEPGRYDAEELHALAQALGAIERSFAQAVRQVSAHDVPLPSSYPLEIVADCEAQGPYVYTVLRVPRVNLAGGTALVPQSQLCRVDGAYADQSGGARYLLRGVPQFFFERGPRLIDLMRSSYVDIKRRALHEGCYPVLR